MRNNKILKKIIAEEVKLFEIIKNISDNEIIIERGTELFHGTIEKYDIKNISPGGYDKIFWTTAESSIAQTYIPKSSMLYTRSESLGLPANDTTTQNIQKQFGIEYDLSQVEFKGSRPTSYKNAPIFKKNDDQANFLNQKAFKLYQEMQKIKKQLNSVKQGNHPIFDKYFEKEEEYENLVKQERANNPTKHRNEYINKKLRELGYEPFSENNAYDHDYSWKLMVDNNQLQPADYSAPGRLLILKPRRDLKITDTTNRGRIEGDLTNLDYHKHHWFEEAKDKGYDGIKINDFAQSSDQGNFGHTSYGLFKNTLKDMDIEEVPATHNPLDPNYRSGDWQSPEYKQHRKIK